MPREKSGHSLYRELSGQSDALDKLCREVSTGIQSAAHYNRLESQAQVIATGLKQAFRGEPNRIRIEEISPAKPQIVVIERPGYHPNADRWPDRKTLSRISND